MRYLTVICAALLASVTIAEAQHRQHRPHHGYQPRYHHHQSRPHHLRPNDWVAPLIGGLVIGGLAAGLAAQSHTYQGHTNQGYDRCPLGTRPARRDLYDQWGRWIGKHRVCVGY
jgi:hypothetical protein